MRLELVLVVLLGLIPLLIANFTVVSDTSAIVRYMPDIGNCDPNFAAATPWKAAVIGDKDSSIVELAQGAAYIAYTALPTEPNKDSWMEFQKTVDIPVGCAIDTAELKVASDNAQEVGIKIGALTNFFPPMGTVYGPADTTQCEACALQTYNAKPFILANQFTIRITTRNYNTSSMPCYPACAPIMNPSVTSFRLGITFSNDVQPPSIIIGSPSNGMTYTVDNVPPLSYTATDNCDNAPNVTVTGYSHLIGIHNLKVEAEDGSGNIASQTITYTVVAPPPPPVPTPELSVCIVKDLTGASSSMIGDTEDVVRRTEESDGLQIPNTGAWSGWKNAVVMVDDANPARPHPDGDAGIHWISYEADNSINLLPTYPDVHRNTWREFQKCFKTCAVQSATLKITGDDAFRVTINGVFVAQEDEVTGPADWGPGDQPWTSIYTYDVKSFLKDGANSLDVLARNYRLDFGSSSPGLDDPAIVTNPTGITYKLEITTLDTSGPVITVSAPMDGATYAYGFVPLPSYSAVDNCDSNPTVSHSNYATSIGTHTMTVTAVDNKGNTAMKSVTYTVSAPVQVGGATNVICPASPPYPPCCISREWWEGGWISLAFTGMFVILLFLGLVYMISVIIARPEYTVWVKDEIYQMLISVAIMLLLVFVLSIICDVFMTLAGNDPFLIAHNYLNNLVWDQTLNLATTAFQYSVICQMLAAYRMMIGPGSLGTGFMPNAGLKAIAVCFDFIYSFFAGISASLMVQDIGLSIIQSFAFRIMLPLGILFRVFPFLRKAGAFLIALSLGLYVVYPLCFVMNKMIVDSVLPQIVLPPIEANIESWLLTVLSPFLPIALVGLYSLMKSAAFLIPQAVFLPTLNLVITLTFIKNAARVLSQNFEEMI